MNLVRQDKCFLDPLSNKYTYWFRDKQCYLPLEVYFKELNDIRREITLPTFVNRTNEKLQTTILINQFLENSLPLIIQNNICSILDIGIGEGDLARHIASAMTGRCERIQYEGIDQSSELALQAKGKLKSIDGVESEVIIGDCFGDKINELKEYPNILIASQVITYAPDIDKFISKVVGKIGGLGFVIGQADGSFLNELSVKFAAGHKQSNTEAKVYEALEKIKVVHYNTSYQSEIKYPVDTIGESLLSIKELSITSYDLLAGKNLEARNILEFIAASPLEYLEYSGNIDKFSSEIEAHLKRNNNTIKFWNYAYVILPENPYYKGLRHIFSKKLVDKMFRKFDELQREISEVSESLKNESFSYALSENNLKIVSQINLSSNTPFVDNNALEPKKYGDETEDDHLVVARVQYDLEGGAVGFYL